MKKSIRSSLFILLVILMVSFVSVGFLLNIFLLERYYVIKNENFMESIVEEVRVVLLEKSNVQDRIEEIDRVNGVSVFIADRERSILLTSFPRKKGDDGKLPTEIEALVKAASDSGKWIPVYSKIQKGNEQAKLVYVGRSSDNHAIVITKSMKGIYESVDMANQFYLISGLLVLAIGSLLMYKFSEKLTKPIIRMSEITEDISNLQFDQRIEVNNRNELGALATSINTLSDKLEVSIDGLKDDIEYQKSLSRNMFHELKTPLGVIKGYAEGLSYGVADTAEMKTIYLATIINECDRMDDLVKEMLELSKLESKEYTLKNAEQFAVKELLEDVVERFQPLIAEQDFNVLIECESRIRILANYRLMDRAISNLISNALKYNDENRYVKLSASETLDSVALSVYNTSKGISEEERRRIFDVFYKVDQARTRESGGNGIGLTIVKSIVELHRGTISVESRKGEVEFVIVLSKTNS